SLSAISWWRDVWSSLRNLRWAASDTKRGPSQADARNRARPCAVESGSIHLRCSELLRGRLRVPGKEGYFTDGGGGGLTVRTLERVFGLILKAEQVHSLAARVGCQPLCRKSRCRYSRRRDSVRPQVAATAVILPSRVAGQGQMCSSAMARSNRYRNE